MGKIIVYQAFARHFSLKRGENATYGTIEQNQCGKFASFNDNFLQSIKKLGTTHLWLTGLVEHASQTAYPELGIEADSPAIVKGVAGSPYAIRDYYSLCPDLAESPKDRESEFAQMLERINSAGLSLIVDFVPNHVSRSYRSQNRPQGIIDLGEADDTSQAFSPQNNFYYLPGERFQSPNGEFEEFPAKVTGNDCFSASPSLNDWYETVKLNYGVDYQGGCQKHFSPIPRTWLQMLDILLFWSEKGVGGFRCDMAEMVPVEFWHFAISRVKERFPNVIFIAEIYNPALYRSYIEFGGFDYLYDKVGFYDTLRAVMTGGLPAKNISHSWQSLGDLQPQMLNFLENHDEQRLASDFFLQNRRRALPALVVSSLMNTNPMMIYAGQELGERGMDAEGFSGLDGRSSIFDYCQPSSLTRWINGGSYDEKLLSSEEKSLLKSYRKILSIAAKNKAISKGKFFDLTYANIENQHFNSEGCFAFLRQHERELLLVVANFSKNPQQLKLFIPSHALDFLALDDMPSVEAKDLISGKKFPLSFQRDGLTEVALQSFQSVVLQIKK